MVFTEFIEIHLCIVYGLLLYIIFYWPINFKTITDDPDVLLHHTPVDSRSSNGSVDTFARDNMDCNDRFLRGKRRLQTYQIRTDDWTIFKVHKHLNLFQLS